MDAVLSFFALNWMDALVAIFLVLAAGAAGVALWRRFSGHPVDDLEHSRHQRAA